MTKNANMRKAKKAKNDEFYTQLSDIEKELKHYSAHFKGKTVYCNCDDAKESKFFYYFYQRFGDLGLKKLITSNYTDGGIGATYCIYEGDGIDIREFEADGDFRSTESIELLKQSDIVVTNPPFSLFREFVAQLEEYGKKYLIVGNKNAIKYKEIFKLIHAGKMRLGKTSPKEFLKPDGILSTNLTGLTRWFTNLEYQRRLEDIHLYKKYEGNEDFYPKYDNYDAINVDKVKDIPCDYFGAMGVPITFLDKHNPDQFEIIDGLNRYSILNGVTTETKGKYLSQVNGKVIYSRIVIKRVMENK